MERTFLTENDIPAIHVYDAISLNVVADSMYGNFEEECVKVFGKPDSVDDGIQGSGRNEDRLKRQPEKGGKLKKIKSYIFQFQHIFH